MLGRMWQGESNHFLGGLPFIGKNVAAREILVLDGELVQGGSGVHMGAVALVSSGPAALDRNDDEVRWQMTLAEFPQVQARVERGLAHVSRVA